jgi:UDP-glucose 4-epimerase
MFYRHAGDGSPHCYRCGPFWTRHHDKKIGLDPMNILVTGGTSHIGAYVVLALLAQGHTLKLLARNPDKIPLFKTMRRMSLVQCDLGDLCDGPRCGNLVDGMDAVVYIAHAGGEGAAKKLLADGLPAITLLETAAAAGVKKFIYTSSTAALGELTKVMPEERQCLPNGWWCANKAAIEDFVMAASYVSPMKSVVVRPSLTFGRPACDNAPREGFPWYRDIMTKITRNETVVLRNNEGTQMTFAGDVARVYGAALETDVNRRIYHASVPERTTQKEFVEKAIALTGSSSRIEIDRDQPPAFDCTYGVENIRTDFGLEFSPWPALEEHIRYLTSNN